MQKFEFFLCDFFHLKLNARKTFKYKQKIFLVYVAKSISFVAIGNLKMRTFAAKLIICLKLLTPMAILVLGTQKFVNKWVF